MKHLKTFENDNNIIFFLIETKTPNFEISLNKINISKYDITTIFLKNKSISSYKEIYIRGKYKNNIFVDIGWIRGDQEGKEYFINKGYEYINKIAVTLEEIEQYELEQTANKYNL